MAVSDLTLDADSRHTPEGAVSERLGDLQFDAAAPAELQQAAQAGPRQFARELRRRGLPRPKHFKRSTRATAAQALWLFPEREVSNLDVVTREALLAARVGIDQDQATNLAAAFLELAEERPELELRQLAAWLTLLPCFSRVIPPDVLLRLWSHLLEKCRALSSQIEGLTLQSHGTRAALLVEVQLRAGIVFRPLQEGQKWIEEGRNGLRQLLSHCCDEEGRPAAGPVLKDAWLDSLVRANTDADAAGIKLWTTADQKRLKRFAGHLAVLCSPEHGLLLAGESATSAIPPLQALLRATGWKKTSPQRRLIDATMDYQGTRTLARRRTLLRQIQRRGSEDLRGRKSLPSAQSDERRVAVLRPDWGAASSVCALDHSQPQPTLEVIVEGERLFSGAWRLDLQIDDQPVAWTQSWKCECWFSDRDADFIELTCDVGDGVTVVRQLLLGRQEPLLSLMTAVRGVPKGRQVICRTLLPLAPGLSAEADGYSRELQLILQRGRIRVFPISLPAPRAVAAAGSLDLVAEDLTLTTRQAGSLCQMLLLDWSDRRGMRPADWSPLTVAEDGRRLTPQESCAARVRVGVRQWLYWHNLTAGSLPRSALGHHSTSETVIARFRPDGTVAPLVHVDAEADGSPEAHSPEP